MLKVWRGRFKCSPASDISDEHRMNLVADPKESPPSMRFCTGACQGYSWSTRQRPDRKPKVRTTNFGRNSPPELNWAHLRSPSQPSSTQFKSTGKSRCTATTTKPSKATQDCVHNSPQKTIPEREREAERERESEGGREGGGECLRVDHCPDPSAPLEILCGMYNLTRDVYRGSSKGSHTWQAPVRARTLICCCWSSLGHWPTCKSKDRIHKFVQGGMPAWDDWAEELTWGAWFKQGSFSFSTDIVVGQVCPDVARWMEQTCNM